MGRQPLPAAAAVNLLAALRRYAAHPDAATAAANAVALVVGGNGPFYPAYVWLLDPEAGRMALLTMAASPFFLAIPWLSRRSALAARIALPIVGLANTLWSTALLGAGSGVGLFLLPCLVLAVLLWRDRLAMLGILGLGLAVQQVLLRWPSASLAGLDPAQQAALVVLNATSVGTLLAFLALTLAGVLRSVQPHAGAGDNRLPARALAGQEGLQRSA